MAVNKLKKEILQDLEDLMSGKKQPEPVGKVDATEEQLRQTLLENEANRKKKQCLEDEALEIERAKYAHNDLLAASLSNRRAAIKGKPQKEKDKEKVVNENKEGFNKARDFLEANFPLKKNVVLQEAEVNKPQADAGKVAAKKTEDMAIFQNKVDNLVAAIRKAKVEKLAAEKLAAEKLEAEKLAAEKVAAEKAEKQVAEKLAAEKAEKQVAEKAAVEKVAAKKQAAPEKAPVEKEAVAKSSVSHVANMKKFFDEAGRHHTYKYYASSKATPEKATPEKETVTKPSVTEQDHLLAAQLQVKELVKDADVSTPNRETLFELANDIQAHGLDDLEKARRTPPRGRIIEPEAVEVSKEKNRLAQVNSDELLAIQLQQEEILAMRLCVEQSYLTEQAFAFFAMQIAMVQIHVVAVETVLVQQSMFYQNAKNAERNSVSETDNSLSSRPMGLCR